MEIRVGGKEGSCSGAVSAEHDAYEWGEELLALMNGFHKLGRLERIERIRTLCGLTDLEVDVLSGRVAPDPAIAENFIENVVGYFPIPLGVATYFKIDGKDVLIPMAVEETSIIAACSGTAKWIRKDGSIRTHVKGRLIIGQIQLPNVLDPAAARRVLHENRERLITEANARLPGLVRRGGGVHDLEIRDLDRADGAGRMMVIHVLCDPCDAMGANLINQVCEGLKPMIEELTGERVGLCILSNLVDGRLVSAEVIIRNIEPELGRAIVEAAVFAKTDPYRATTHNKGVLNGIDPILIATGNDWRAVEAGVHAYASRSGKYQPVTDWKIVGNDLVGTIEVPLAVGTVGGVTRTHPTAKVAMKMLGVEHSDDLARIIAAVGLVQNLGALRALATVGIVQGHMRLHAANLAIAAGAELHEVGHVRDQLARLVLDQKAINVSEARDILEQFRGARAAGETLACSEDRGSPTLSH
jgi:hydroxymethylglutaryl-CoA reductase